MGYREISGLSLFQALEILQPRDEDGKKKEGEYLTVEEQSEVIASMQRELAKEGKYHGNVVETS